MERLTSGRNNLHGLFFFVKFLLMKSSDKKEVFAINCPICRAVLWIDPITQEVIKSEKGKRKKESLEELLVKEKKRKDKFGRKFEATAELEKEKMEKVKEKFEKALVETQEVVESEKEEEKEET